MFEHKNPISSGFTAKYRVRRLLYFEHFTDARSAIAREKQVKGWSRAKKLRLIESTNPSLRDLAGTASAAD